VHLGLQQASHRFSFFHVARERKVANTLKDFSHWVSRCTERKTLMHRKMHFTETPIKPLRVYEEMNKAVPRDTIDGSTIGLSQTVATRRVARAWCWPDCLNNLSQK